MGYIYKITNSVNNLSYVGKSYQLNIQDRWRCHKKINSKNGCPLLKNAIKTFGIENFIFSIIIICFDSDLDYYEKEYIKKYNTVQPNGYNMLAGGDNLPVYEGIPVYQFGLDKKLIREFKNKCEASRILKDICEYTIRKSISKKISVKNFYWSHNKDDLLLDYEEKKSSSRPVYQYDLNGKFLKEFKNISIAKKETGSTTISSCIANNSNISNNFIWRTYKTDFLENFKNKKEGGISIKVYQFDINGNLLNTYNSLSDAHKETKSPISSLSLCLKNNKNFCNGFYWSKDINFKKK